MYELEQIEKDFDNLINSYSDINKFGIFDLNNILYGYKNETNTYNNGIIDYLNNLNRFYKNLPSQNVDLDTFDKISQKFDEVQEKIKNKKEEVSKILEAKEKDLESINSKISDFKKQIKQIDEEIKKQPNDLNLQLKKIDLENNLDKEYNKKMVNEFGENFKNKNILYRNRVARINKRLNQKNKLTQQQAQQNNQQQTQSSQSKSTQSGSSGPIQGGQTGSASTQTQQQTQQPSVKKNSIQYYINNKKIPQIPENELSDILDTLNIDHSKVNNVYDLVLENETLNRILSSKAVNMYKMKDKISNKEIIKGYDSLLKNYDDKKESLKENGAKDEADYFDDVSNKLTAEKAQEDIKIKSINVDDIQSYNLSGKESKRLGYFDKKIFVNDENLNAQYRLLEGYKLQKNNSNKKLIQKRINKTGERIKKLQQKQGKLIEKQTMIVNKNNAKYIKHVKRKQKLYAINQGVSSVLVQGVNSNLYRIEDSNERTNLNNFSITNLSGNSLSEKARRGILKGNNKVLQARIAAAKKIRCISSSLLEQQLRFSTNQIKGQVAHAM